MYAEECQVSQVSGEVRGSVVASAGAGCSRECARNCCPYTGEASRMNNVAAATNASPAVSGNHFAKPRQSSAGSALFSAHPTSHPTHAGTEIKSPRSMIEVS